MKRQGLALVLCLLLSGACAQPVGGAAGVVDGATLPGTPSADDTTTDLDLIQAQYVECGNGGYNLAVYLLTGSPRSMDGTKYAQDRMTALRLSGEQRDVFVRSSADAYISACDEKQAKADRKAAAAQEAEEQQRQDEAAAAKLKAKRKSTCASVHGEWYDENLYLDACSLEYKSAEYGSVGGFTLDFDGNGNIVGDRGSCPDAAWHANTRICSP